MIRKNYMCCVCYKKNDCVKNVRFNCIDTYHHTCKKCCDNYISFGGNKCPLCRAELLPHMKNPKDISLREVIYLEVINIRLADIYFHANIKLPPNAEIMEIKSKSGVHKFYGMNGYLLSYNGMFLAENGFLYNHIKENNIYHLAIMKNKYQYWNLSDT